MKLIDLVKDINILYKAYLMIDPNGDGLIVLNNGVILEIRKNFIVIYRNLRAVMNINSYDAENKSISGSMYCDLFVPASDCEDDILKFVAVDCMFEDVAGYLLI